VANSNAVPETRALAIRALGLVKTREIRKIMDPWLEAPDSVVRAAAVLLFTDFAKPHEYTTGLYAGYAADKAPEVRKCAAYSIGFMQDADMVPVLSKLIKDEDKTVRRAAMQSLHSFRPEIPAVTAALKADLGNPESQPLSLLALARENPGAHLEALAQVVEEKISPANWSSGQIPHLPRGNFFSSICDPSHPRTFNPGNGIGI
jgi:HEAT repeat protein